jgi:hypothetical protein
MLYFGGWANFKIQLKGACTLMIEAIHLCHFSLRGSELCDFSGLNHDLLDGIILRRLYILRKVSGDGVMFQVTALHKDAIHLIFVEIQWQMFIVS